MTLDCPKIMCVNVIKRNNKQIQIRKKTNDTKEFEIVFFFVFFFVCGKFIQKKTYEQQDMSLKLNLTFKRLCDVFVCFPAEDDKNFIQWHHKKSKWAAKEHTFYTNQKKKKVIEQSLHILTSRAIKNLNMKTFQIFIVNLHQKTSQL